MRGTTKRGRRPTFVRPRDEEAKKRERNPEERALLGRHRRPTFDLTGRVLIAFTKSSPPPRDLAVQSCIFGSSWICQAILGIFSFLFSCFFFSFFLYFSCYPTSFQSKLWKKKVRLEILFNLLTRRMFTHPRDIRINILSLTRERCLKYLIDTPGNV